MCDRNVWVCDSFEGLPPPSGEYPADAASAFHDDSELAVSLDQVRANFESYGLLDDQVRFAKGWFRDTMPLIDVGEIAVLRLDGDMYESTIDPLNYLYDRAVSGGWIVVDDYRLLDCCQAAVHDFASSRGFEPDLVSIDHVGVYWRKA
ncbi:MAG: class I SAM-dependent methyltransferase [Acidimicrobiales bacterium]|nr:class I SAM-dependent methyltransferase [Acidimicrobiales bacterium]